MSNDGHSRSASSQPGSSPEDSGYTGYLNRLQANFQEYTAPRTLFTTDATQLWELYLAALPAESRQQFTCHECRRFIQGFGHLVTLDETGVMRSAFWDERQAAPLNTAAVRALRERVEQSRVTGVFLSSQPVWGKPETGAWKHLAVTVPEGRVFRPSLLDAGQRMAELREHSRCLNLALAEFPAELLDKARVILQADALSRSEKFIGVVEWLLARQHERRGPHGPHLLWRAVASAPAGFCTPRASMVGSLLSDLAEGLPFETVKSRFDAKMHPLRYQRPQAAPSAGNVQQAEAAIARLGLAPALERRFATLADVQLLWSPRQASDTPKAGGLFGHLRTREEARVQELSLPARTLTWVKFRDTVLSTAERVELRVPERSTAFSALVTAVHPDAPPLVQWDSLEQRNPVSWYFYPGGSDARDWGLPTKDVEVLGVTTKPNTWFSDRFARHGQGVFFVLKGACDSRTPGLALFPELLRGELHGVRATLEAYSKSRELKVPQNTPLASGMMFAPSEGSPWNLSLRVTSQGAVTTYTLDRWD